MKFMTKLDKPASDEHRKLVRVSDLRIGMDVCELDRPWLEVPFEPPFQLQGFRIKSADEVEKIRQHCSHVFIDTERRKRKSSAVSKRSRKLFLIGVYRSIQSGIANKVTAKRRKHGGQMNSQSSVLPGSSSKSLAQATTGDYENLYNSESDHSNLPRKYEILASNSPKRIIYQNQTTLEEEYETANKAIDAANSLYSDLIDEAQNNKQLDYPKLRERVGTMARSIVRNPDALSYLVRIKSFNKETYELAISSSVMVMAFARFLGLSNDEIKNLGTGALLQDVGMVKVPPEILNKNGPLSETEYKLVKRHVAFSRSMVEQLPGISKKVVSVCYSHHERYDGSGYPRRLTGNQIPLFSMITGIVDTYMALTRFNSYNRTRTSYQALCKLAELKDAQFLGALVDRFIQNIAIFPVGSFVQLNSGHIGIIVARNPMRFLEPKVMLILDQNGNRIEQELTINFASEEKNRFFNNLKISGEVMPDEYGVDPQEFFALQT
jgi:HD-GYP domain-containing protein (c-di-GMP phosphodiesterase class II)